MVFLSPLLLGGEVATPRFTQYFHGSLSGLTIRPGRIETQKVISCLQACKEGLDINSLESLAKDIKVCGEKIKAVFPIHKTHTYGTFSDIAGSITTANYLEIRTDVFHLKVLFVKILFQNSCPVILKIVQ